MMSCRHVLKSPRIHMILVPFVLLCCVPTAMPQSCTGCLGSVLPGEVGGSTFANPSALASYSVANPDPWIIHKHVDEVTVFFTATRGHKYVEDLTQDEVIVTDDRKPVARLSAFGHQSDLALRMGLLIDTSNSIHYRFAFEKEAASRFLKKIVRPGEDRAFVIGFSDQATLAQDYTGDPEALAKGISSLQNDGGTALYDAVRLACEKLADGASGETTARTLVVLSDGDDNASKTSLNSLIDIAQHKEVTIYTISTNNSGTVRNGDRILKELALGTGGQMFLPYTAKETVKAFAAIEREMRSRYALSYHPTELLEDGRYHRIEIRAEKARKKLRVHARKGYYAPVAVEASTLTENPPN